MMETTGKQSFGDKIHRLLTEQKREWPLACSNYADLEKIEKRTLFWDSGTTINIQFNSARIRSTGANIDKHFINERPCFLCEANRPREQKYELFSNAYQVLVNPFPIFPEHLTIPLVTHQPQRIKGHFQNLLKLAEALPDFVIFYNGPRCGASAPDHFHFQAGNKGGMPVEEEVLKHPHKFLLNQVEDVRVFSIDQYLRKILILEGENPESLNQWFQKIFHHIETLQPQEEEPMMNVLCIKDEGIWRVCIFPRGEHRPWQYYAEEDHKVLLSPGAVDMGGLLITPRREDFEKLDKDLVADVFRQVTLDEEKWRSLQNAVKNML